MGVYYKKTHKIAGINFLPRLTLAEYNNLTVKPEHWIRTDSPFDYSKTDVPKLTLVQYQDLAIKPKFWIRTDAPESYTNISATQVDVTDSVSVKDYLDDLDATQVAYGSGVSVKDIIKGVIVDEIPANTYSSYALALQALNTAFSALTTEQKMRTILVRDTIIYYCTATSGAFMSNYPSNATTVSAQAIFLPQGYYLNSSILGNTISTTDLSSNAQSQSLKLIRFE